MKAKKYVINALCMSLFIGSTQLFINSGYAQQVMLTKQWETEASLPTPESVLYDKANNILYVSNINGQAGDKDGNGSIGKVSLTGKVENAEWVKGLDAPKGLGLVKNLLYVADLTKVVVIDTKAGKIVKTIEVPGAIFLNDITVDGNENVYVSDSTGKKVFRISNNVVSLWLESDLLQRPNGLLAYQNKMYLVDMPTGIFYLVDNTTKALTKVAEGLPGGDGIVPVGSGDFLISNWNGEINYVTAKGQVTKLIDTKEAKVNAADIEYIPAKRLLLVPTFFHNRVVAYQLKK